MRGSTVLRGEVVRVLSTRLPMWGLLTAAGAGLLPTAVLGLVGPENATPPLPPLSTPSGVGTALGIVGLTLFLPALLGTVAITAEHRHRTVATTFLAVPRRERVLAAKLVVYGGLGAAYGIVLAAAATAGLLAAAAARGVALGMPVAEIAALGGRLAVAATVHVLLGVAIGALVHHQIAAIGVTLGYFYAVEPVLMLVPGVNALHPVLPGGATASLTRSSVLSDLISSELSMAGPRMTSPAVGASVLLAYVVVAAVVATMVPLRRDVT